jgi:hypothetical protein
MAAIYGRSRHRAVAVLRPLLGLGMCALAASACSSAEPDPAPSYQAAAIAASQSGDQKGAVELARKEVARFSSPDQCSREVRLNCGTLALAYGSLSEYQILAGDRASGESSFRSARDAIDLMDPANKPSAIGIVYRDVSEAYWKVGDRERAVEVFRAGRAAGGDGWLRMAAAAQVDGLGVPDVPKPVQGTGRP